jgi:hypothetical protein
MCEGRKRDFNRKVEEVEIKVNKNLIKKYQQPDFNS